MEDKLRKSYMWSMIYLIIEFLLVYILRFVTSEKVLYLGIIGFVYMIVNLIFIKYKRESLFVNGVIFFVIVIMLGVLAGSHLKVEGIIAIGIAVSIVDVLSFTKYGKRTANAKVMSDIKLMSKLIVYGRGKGETLYPTCGIGDYLYFSLWLSGLSKNIHMLVFLSGGILLGNLINDIIIYKIHSKPNYKGMPATIIPFICMMICYFIMKGTSVGAVFE